MRIKLLLIFILSFCFYATKLEAQNLSGRAVIDGSHTEASEILIENKTQNIRVKTNDSGDFSIPAKAEDLIVFSGSFVETRQFFVTQTALDNPNFTIHLNIENIKLDDLNVNKKLSGDMQKDLATVRKDERKKELYKNLGFDVSIFDLHPEEKKEQISTGLNLNLGALYKNLSGYYRKMKNRQDYDSYIERINYVRDFMGESFFTKILKLPAEEIERFLIFVENRKPKEFNEFYQSKSMLGFSNLLENDITLYLDRIKNRDAQNK
ncbi:hypothetical protein [Ornithobacterium rhinotracheale]|uniref:hypothetical protein n=1 Tax=Ornithobacterium rhinotracheale TaxID=28251 RepID=UPI001FF4D7F4|nr:hypothetical protein [Ornithobacterium rhinotracheale]MCK0199646.1 hypothetical protein [Ornithobacterium rhinotracheale]